MTCKQDTTSDLQILLENQLFKAHTLMWCDGSTRKQVIHKCTLCPALCALFPVPCAFRLHPVPTTRCLCPVPCALCIHLAPSQCPAFCTCTPCAQHSVPCALCSILCALYPVPTLYYWPHSLCPFPCALCPVPFLCAIPCALCPIPEFRLIPVPVLNICRNNYFPALGALYGKKNRKKYQFSAASPLQK